jgi:5'-nucleotidase/UDP-sugar diphosphatase
MKNHEKVKENRNISGARRRAPMAAAILVSGAIALGIVSCAGAGHAAPAHAAGRGPASASIDSLVVLHTNDVHSHLEPFETRGGATVGGAAARAALIAREKARGGRVLLLDAGDLVQGTPYYNVFRGEPDHKILDLIGYDAIALGNHDLDDGVAAWLARAAKTKTPILSANVFVTGGVPIAEPLRGDVPAALVRSAKWIGGGKVPPTTALHALTVPYVILNRGALKVAILGLTTYSLDRIVAPGKNKGVAVGSPAAAAQYYVPLLRRQADVVIALTHLGVDDDRELVRQVPGIDLVIGGHSHTPLFRPVLERAQDGRATPITQAGSWGQYLGRTTLRWSGGHLTSTAGRLITIRPSEGEDASIAALVASYRSRLGADLERVVFHSARRLESTGLNEGDHPLGNFVADVIRGATGADIAVMNAGGIRAPLPAGDVRERDLLSMLPFDNRLVVVSMTGSQVRQLLDRISRHLGKSGFGHVSGLSYIIQRDRAVDVRLWGNGSKPGTWHGRNAGPGEPLDGNRVYRVGTIDFLANGGDYFDELRDAATKEPSDVLLSKAAIDFLRAHPDYPFKKDGRAQWRGSGESLRDLGVR